jgi:hypothetical protein
LAVPHLGQTISSFEPQPPQKRRPSRLFTPHFEQRIVSLAGHAIWTSFTTLARLATTALCKKLRCTAGPQLASLAECHDPRQTPSPAGFPDPDFIGPSYEDVGKFELAVDDVTRAKFLFAVYLKSNE